MNGAPKQLLSVKGKTLLRHTAETALRTNFDKVVIVLGANAERFVKEILDLPVVIAVNENWQKGMGSSIKTGLAALIEENLDAVIIMLCDQPLITAKTLENLAEIFACSGNSIVACKYKETIGVPALFSSRLFQELLNLKNQEGAKKLIKKHRENAVLVSVPEAEFDIDTIEDYEKFKQFSRFS